MAPQEKFLKLRKILGVGIRAAFLMGLSINSIANTIMVDDDGQECPDAQFSTIQAAVDAAPPNGSKIRVCPGIYDEQVVVEKPVRIKGDNGAIIMPSGMVANTTNLITGNDIAAAIVVRNTERVILQGLTIDTLNNGIVVDESTCGPGLMGVLFQDSSGQVHKMAIRNLILENQEVICESGHGIFVQTSDEGVSNVKISGNSIHDYQKGGIVANGEGTKVQIVGNMISGAGPISSAAANGIQVAFGAEGLVKLNTVADNLFADCESAETCSFAASSILVFDADKVNVFQNTFGNAQINAFAIGDNYKVKSNQIHHSQIFDGILVVGNGNQIQNNRIFNSAQTAVHIASGDNNKIISNAINEATTGISIDDGLGNMFNANRINNTLTKISQPEAEIVPLAIPLVDEEIPQLPGSDILSKAKPSL